MAKGKKYNDDIKEMAYALLTVNNNVQYVADKLNLPYSTVQTWKEKLIKNNDKSNFVEVREKNKEKFIDKAWQLIADSLTVAQKRITRELKLEENVDIVADALKKNAKKIEEEKGVGWFELLGLIDELKKLKNFKLGEISTLIGTIYDKQALANKEATAILDGSIAVKKFEDF